MKKLDIAVIAGGDSSEYIISIKSAGEIMKQLDRELFSPWLVVVKNGEWIVKSESEVDYPLDLNTFSFHSGSESVRFNYAYLIVHGTPAEDGKIQAYLDMKGVPYNTCGVLSSALSFNKFACKNYLKGFGVLTAKAVIIRKTETFSRKQVLETTGLPCFVKPNNGGSSFGTSKVNSEEQFDDALKLAFQEDQEVIVESYIKGTELSCGLVKFTNEEYIFPVTEIVPKKEFFDYEAKYTEGMSEEITPARISEELTEKCKNIASGIYDYLACKGIVRIDFIASGNQLYFLELNSIPGMSRESIVPKQIRALGLSVEEMITKVIRNTLI